MTAGERVSISAGDVGTLTVQPATRADRLKELLLKALPDLAEQIKSGEWGKAGAPYSFKDLSDGRQQLTVENAVTGDRIGVVGKDRDELLDKLEARLPNELEARL